jgi:hypothetical protein
MQKNKPYVVLGIPLIESTYLLAWIFLAVFIVLSPHNLIYDEVYHLGAVNLIQTQGFYSAMVSPANQSAAGPLYSFLHLIFSSLSDLNAPFVRWINIFLLFLVVFLISKTSWSTKKQNISFQEATLCMLGVPFVWPCVGIALTEIPALVFFTVSLVCISKIISSDCTKLQLTLGVVAGIALGIAILGRQTYLVILPCLVVWAVFQRKFWLPVVTIIVISLISCGWIFIIWKGLVPPSQRSLDGGLRIDHAILAASYIGVAGLILAPKILREIPVLNSILFGILIGGICSWYLGFETVPAKSLITSLFGAQWAVLIGAVALAVMIGLAGVWLLALSKFSLAGGNPFLVLNWLLLMAFIAAPAKISHLFSSRYVVSALIPLIILTGFERSKISIALKIVGMLVGAATLVTYYRAV